MDGKTFNEVAMFKCTWIVYVTLVCFTLLDKINKNDSFMAFLKTSYDNNFTMVTSLLLYLWEWKSFSH